MFPNKTLAYVFWVFVAWMTIQDFRSQNHRKWVILASKRNKMKREFRANFYKRYKLTRHPNNFACTYWRQYWTFGKEANSKKKDSTTDGIPFMNKITDLDRGRPTSLNKKSKKILPIGALTYKPFAFNVRSWDNEPIHTRDVTEPLGSYITIQASSVEIKRILPRKNENLNDYWISNNSRFFFDSLKRWRLTTPIKQVDGKYMSVTWLNSYYSIDKEFTKLDNSFKIINSKFSDLLTVWWSKKTLANIGKHFSNYNLPMCNTLRDYKLPLRKLLNNDEIVNIGFVGNNIKLENPVLNLRFRKLSKLSNFNFFSIGSFNNFLIKQKHISISTESFFKILEGKHLLSKLFSISNKQNKLSNNSFILLGNDFLKFNKFKFSNQYNNINIKYLMPDLGLMSLAFIGVNNKLNRNDLKDSVSFYFNTTYAKIRKNDYNVYVGHHWNLMFLDKFQMFLPTLGPYERTVFYTNFIDRIPFGIPPFLPQNKFANNELKNPKDEYHIFQLILVILNSNDDFFTKQKKCPFNISCAPKLTYKKPLKKNMKFRVKNNYLINQQSNFYKKDILCLSSSYLKEARDLEENKLKDNFLNFYA